MDNGLFVPFKPKLGRPPKYTPEELLKKFQAYLRDRKARTIEEEAKEFGSTGNTDIDKTSMRRHCQPISIGDFCVFLGCCRNWWNELADDYLGVKEYIRTYIEEFQLKGATIGVFNPNIVARRLGLVEKTQTTTESTQHIIVENAEQKAKLQDIANIEG